MWEGKLEEGWQRRGRREAEEQGRSLHEMMSVEALARGGERGSSPREAELS